MIPHPRQPSAESISKGSNERPLALWTVEKSSGHGTRPICGTTHREGPSSHPRLGTGGPPVSRWIRSYSVRGVGHASIGRSKIVRWEQDTMLWTEQTDSQLAEAAEAASPGHGSVVEMQRRL